MSQQTALALPLGEMPRYARAPRTGDRLTRLTAFRGMALVSLACVSQTAWGQEASGVEVVDQFTFIGEGETRATNSLSFEDLQTLVPGISPDKAIDLIPGVNVNTTDPFGFYEFGNDIRLRAFRVRQIAVSVDGVPMGSNSPRYGTPVGRVLDNENIGNLQVNQGAGDVSAPAYEALGGLIQYSVVEPTEEPGALVKGTIGDQESRRLFARVNTGTIVDGLTAWISASDFSFLAQGTKDASTRNNLATNIQYKMEGAKFNFQYTYNDRDDYDTQDVDYNYWKALDGPRLTPAEAAAKYPGDTDLQKFAQYGFIEYSPLDPRFAPGTSGELGDFFLYGDYSDNMRDLGPPFYIVPGLAAGTGVNSIHGSLWRNGRMDHFLRFLYDIDLTDELKWTGNTYYQDKMNYGTWGVDTATATREALRGYAYQPSRTDITGVNVIRNTAGQPIRFVPGEGGAVTEVPWTGPVGTFARPVESAFSDPAAYLAALSAWRTTINDIAGQFRVDPTVAGGIPGRTGRDEDFGGHRYGFYNNLAWEVTSNNTVSVGFWYEYDRHRAYRPNYDIEGGGITSWFDYDQVLFNNYLRKFETDVVQVWIKDEWQVIDSLKLAGGIKGLRVERSVEGLLSNQAWRESLYETRDATYEDYFLPQIGFVWDVSDSFSVFGNWSRNIAAPIPEAMVTAGFNTDLAEEKADNYDLGIRYKVGPFQVSSNVFYIKYEDRIVQTSAAVGTGSFLAGDSIFDNVGAIDSYGWETAAEYQTPIDGLRLIGALAYQISEFNDDSLSYDGNSLGGTPEWTAQLEGVYTWKWLTASLRGKYYDEIFVNYRNTQVVPDYFIMTGSVTLRGPEGSKLEPFSATLQVDNLLDEDIIYASDYDAESSGRVRADPGRFVTFTVSAEF